MTSPERFMQVLDSYIDAAITARISPSSSAATARVLARQTVINELRLLLPVGEDARKSASQWRRG